MIASHEPPLANGAGKFFFSRVSSFVPGQFVAAREPSATVLVRAGERSLPGVNSRVSFQMRRFEIIFSTTRMLAFVNTPTGRGIRKGSTGRAYRRVGRIG